VTLALTRGLDALPDGCRGGSPVRSSVSFSNGAESRGDARRLDVDAD
jgi:hypothetical protein